MRPVRKILALSACCAVLAAAAVVLAAPEDDHDAHHAEEQEHATLGDAAEALSPELRKLLAKEMQLIDDGMGELLTALSAGEWKVVEQTAAKIKHSFILKQQLDEQQLHELHEKLPAEFLRLDVRFHETAGKLASVAHHRDAELAVFYYSRMVEACVHCHAVFAPRSFPGLAKHEDEGHRH